MMLGRDAQVAAGLDYGFSASDARALYRKWHSHFKNAERRQLKGLTFIDYLKVAARDGVSSSEIGRGPGQYQLGRVGDTGDYKVKTCRFITAEQNRDECYSNGGYRRGGDKQKGRSKHTHENHANASQLYSKPFLATKPSGLRILGRNLTEFCRAYSLNKGRVCHIARNTDGLYKGWSFEYITERRYNRLAKTTIDIWKDEL